MFEGLLRMIEQRMASLGFTKFHYELVRVLPSGGLATVTIDAHNEFYYLTSKTVPASLRIVSDTEIFNSTDASGYANFNFYNFKEFSGNIKIDQAVAIDLEFIRVVPEF